MYVCMCDGGSGAVTHNCSKKLKNYRKACRKKQTKVFVNPKPMYIIPAEYFFQSNSPNQSLCLVHDASGFIPFMIKSQNKSKWLYTPYNIQMMNYKAEYLKTIQFY